MKSRETLLKPEKSTHFWWYVLGVLLTPLFGAGVVLIYIKIKELNSTFYKISDSEIRSVSPEYSETTDLVSITDTTVHQRWIDKQFSIGTVRLHTRSKTTVLNGIRNPFKISDIILQAAEAERRRIKEAQKTKPVRNETETAGSIDRLEYLTGLWQQGLITNEEFEQERKNMGI